MLQEHTVAIRDIGRTKGDSNQRYTWTHGMPVRMFVTAGSARIRSYRPLGGITAAYFPGDKGDMA